VGTFQPTLARENTSRSRRNEDRLPGGGQRITRVRRVSLPTIKKQRTHSVIAGLKGTLKGAQRPLQVATLVHGRNQKLRKNNGEVKEGKLRERCRMKKVSELHMGGDGVGKSRTVPHVTSEIREERAKEGGKGGVA